MTASTTDARLAYESWHEQLPDDLEGRSPWHGLVREHLDPTRDLAAKRVLEIACGRGGLACWLARQSPPPAVIVAADFATSAIRKGRELSRRNGIEGIVWQVANIEALPHPEATFDTVISCETIEHVPHPRRAIREMSRVLRPGGRLFLTTPNYLGPLGLYRLYLRLRRRVYTETGQPINHLTLLPITYSWVTRAGLRVTKVDAIGHYLPFPGRPPIEMRHLNGLRNRLRWLGLHSLVISEKNQVSIEANT